MWGGILVSTIRHMISFVHIDDGIGTPTSRRIEELLGDTKPLHSLTPIYFSNFFDIDLLVYFP
jgi:hypothetical protein